MQIQHTRRILFGWSRTEAPDPADYQIQASNPDFFTHTSTGRTTTVSPTESLLKRLSRQLSDTSGARFVVITGLMRELKLSRQEVYNFQERLMTALGKKKRLIARVDTALDGSPDSGVDSTTPLHFDGKQAKFLSLAYGPFQGLKPGEGVPRLGDWLEWNDADRAETKRLFELETGDDDSPMSFTDRNVLDVIQYAAGEYFGPLKQALTQTHAIELDTLDFETDIPIIILNNRPDQGVLHGATDVKARHQAQDISRPVRRVTLERKSR